MKKKKEKKYAFPLQLDPALKEPIVKLSEVNRRSINEEMNVAIELYIDNNKDKIKK